jgi:hypothetical protein
MNKEELFQQLHYRPSQMEMTGITDSRRHLWELYQRCIMSYPSECLIIYSSNALAI